MQQRSNFFRREAYLDRHEIKVTSAFSEEFPAVGWRRISGGSLYEAGENGGCWSSVTDGADLAYRLYFRSSDLGMGVPSKRLGYSVRCVR
ncbi:MAG: hypothetical protein K2N21_07560 [Rikenellaceae bacterium]|nr:hypothetical protein [Rikenellaceae bacterium]